MPEGQKVANPEDFSVFDPNFTQHCIDTIGPKASPRNRQIFTALFKHLHDFTREVELTTVRF